MHHQEPFGALLRHYRLACGLSQEALAERAGLTAQAISALERGLRRAPYRHTVRTLAAALALSPLEQAALEAAVVRSRGARHPPGDSDFTLPVPPSALVGRARDVAAVVELLGRESTRLVTLTGTGGVGKTHLALAVAWQVRERVAGGVVFVGLAPLREASLMPTALLQALGLRDDPSRGIVASVAGHLRSRHVLLLLDNFEHVLDAAPLVGELLAACPALQVLVTSRVALRLRPEHLYTVAPLATPDPDHLPSLQDLEEVAAVRLLVGRAREMMPDFALTPTNAAAIAAITRRLDGLPLALELAVPRLSILSPALLLERLERRLPLLEGGPRDLPARQQTLRATLGWSYDLLGQREQAAFRWLAVPAGGCTLDAAEALIAPLAETPDAALPLLEALIEKSLLVRGAEAGTGEPRLGMLETVREYGWERLAEAGDRDAAQGRHAAYYGDLAARAEPELRGPDQVAWLERLEDEHDNLRAALHWVVGRRDAGAALRLAAALGWFWYTHSLYQHEGRGWLEQALALDPPGANREAVALRIRALTMATHLARLHADYAQATAWAQESIALCQAVDDKVGWGAALYALGTIAHDRTAYGEAAELLGQSAALRNAAGDQQGTADALNALGLVAWAEGDHSRAADLLAQSLGLKRQLGDGQGMATALTNLGELWRQQGAYADAVALQEEALTIKRGLNDPAAIALSLINLGHLARAQGHETRARELYRESLTTATRVGYHSAIPEALESIAALASSQGRHRRAAWICGAAAALRRALSEPGTPSERAAHAVTMERLRARLDGVAYEEAWAEGGRASLDAVLGVAQGDTDA